MGDRLETLNIISNLWQSKRFQLQITHQGVIVHKKQTKQLCHMEKRKRHYNLQEVIHWTSFLKGRTLNTTQTFWVFTFKNKNTKFINLPSNTQSTKLENKLVAPNTRISTIISKTIGDMLGRKIDSTLYQMPGFMTKNAYNVGKVTLTKHLEI